MLFRYSILPSLSLTGILSLNVVKGSFTADTFRTFVELTLLHMNPYPGPNSVLIMDNCNIHKNQEVLDVIIAKYAFLAIYVPRHIVLTIDHSGSRYMFLPPYSPDLNPIELAFSAIKSSIRRDGEMLRETMVDDEEVFAMFQRHVTSVTPADARGWFGHCGYV